MIAFYPGQPLGPDSREFILVTVWKDRKAMANYTHDDWANAIIPEEAFPLLEEWHINGYKSFGVIEPQLKPIFQNL
jgi:hypothetical protein